MPESVATMKSRQRGDALARRASMTAAARVGASQAIVARVVNLVGAAAPVAAFAPTEGEVALDDLLERWLEEGRAIALPRVAGPRHLTLHRVTDLADLTRSAYGIREPQATAPVVPPEDVSFCVAPGVVFDRGRRRIGYGGGFYDALIPTMVNATVAAVAFEVQLVDRVAAESHDVCVDMVVTEGAVYR